MAQSAMLPATTSGKFLHAFKGNPCSMLVRYAADQGLGLTWAFQVPAGQLEVRQGGGGPAQPVPRPDTVAGNIVFVLLLLLAPAKSVLLAIPLNAVWAMQDVSAM